MNLKKVQGLGFRVWGLGFFGFRVEGLNRKGSGLRVSGLRVQKFGFRV